MPRQFHRQQPLQAGKLAGSLVVVLLAVATIAGVFPSHDLASNLLLAVLLSFALALVILLETLLGLYRIIRDDRSLLAQFRDNRLSAVARTFESLAALSAVVLVVAVISMIPAGPMAGPGAIGLMFILVGLAILIHAGSLIRTLVAYRAHRRSGSTPPQRYR